MSELNVDPIAWWWNPDVDAATLGQMLTNNKGRLISLDVFFAGNQQRLAAVWVSNTGNQNQAWWWNPNVDDLGIELWRHRTVRRERPVAPGGGVGQQRRTRRAGMVVEP